MVDARGLRVAAILVAVSMMGRDGFAQARVGVKHVAGAVDASKNVEPTGRTVVIDTTMGRITCRLYEKEAPVTSANFLGLAEGSKDWKDPATDQMVHAKAFYDGTGLAGVTDGILGGERLGSLRGTAGAPFATEKSGLGMGALRGLRGMCVAPPPYFSSKTSFFHSNWYIKDRALQSLNIFMTFENIKICLTRVGTIDIFIL